MNDRERSFVSAVDKTELVELTRDLVRIDSVIRPEKGGTERMWSVLSLTGSVGKLGWSPWWKKSLRDVRILS